MIILEENAYNQAKLLQKENSDYFGKPLRLYIEGKGCDGFYYGVTFDEPNSEDLSFKQDDISIIIDPDSYIFCQDVSITWVDDERGRGFLVENHNQKKFRGKFYKRPSWQKKLKQGSVDAKD